MNTFESALRRAMGGKIGAQKLSSLSGIPCGTIESWLQGRTKRPRDWRPILTIAQALLLGRADTDALLLAASHATIDELASRLAPDHPDRRHLQPWLNSPPPAPSARHQLRAPIQDFVGRSSEIASLRAALLQGADSGSAAAITGVQGMGGIGKTELAYVLAHQVRHAFPDAQILLALRGSTTTPMSPQQALQTAIRAFLPDAKLSDELPALEALYRTQLDTRRVLILADDAASAMQVEPLLPPTGSALLVTSRVRFTLPAMTTIDLEQLPPAEAIHLLRSICPRLGGDEAATLARTCGYLPLALRISAGLLRNTPALAVADYLAQLMDEQQRLNHLCDPDDPQRDVAAALSLSYAQLDSAAQAVFRQLGVLVADFATSLAQAIVMAPKRGNVTSILYHLQRRNLILYDAKHARWRLHDLVRDLAWQQLEIAGEADATQWRYARAAVTIVQEIQEQYQAGGDRSVLALAHFDIERAHFDVARRWAQCHTQSLDGDQLLLDAAQAIRYFQELRYDWRYESIPLWESVRTAVRRLDNRTGEAHSLRFLGNAYYYLGELHTAITYEEQACAIALELGDRLGEGIALGNLGAVYALLREIPKAISYLEQALVIVSELGDYRTAGYALGNLGLVYTELGDIRHAIECCEAALTITRATGHRRAESYILSYLARAQAIQKDTAQATTTFAQASALFREIGDRLAEAECNWLFGLALAQHGEREQALPLLRTAVAYRQAIGHTKADEHAALVARLEAGEALPWELHILPAQHAVGDDQEASIGRQRQS